MSEENVEIVRRAFAFDVYGEGDPDPALSDFDPNVVWNPIEEGPSYGLKATRETFDRWESEWDELEMIPEEFIDAGDRVLVVALFRGRGRASGADVEARFYEVYALRDGKVVRVDEFTEREEALEAAGLSE